MMISNILIKNLFDRQTIYICFKKKYKPYWANFIKLADKVLYNTTYKKSPEFREEAIMAWSKNFDITRSLRHLILSNILPNLSRNIFDITIT